MVMLFPHHKEPRTTGPPLISWFPITIYPLTSPLIFDIMISWYQNSKEGEKAMNNSNVATVEKIMIPLRLQPDIYVKLRQKVYDRKEKLRGYSMNEYITELILKDLAK